jgi:hypothetical protein
VHSQRGLKTIFASFAVGECWHGAKHEILTMMVAHHHDSRMIYKFFWCTIKSKKKDREAQKKIARALFSLASSMISRTHTHIEADVASSSTDADAIEKGSAKRNGTFPAIYFCA